MRRQNVNDLLAFIAVAREGSFTKAAAKLGVSQSALSYTIRTLEERLGLRVLTRTTRSVGLTEAGERLLGSIGPRFDEIERDIQALGEMRDKPAGTVGINSIEHAAETILWPAMARLLPQYPDVNVEIISDYGLTDIVAERYDAGVRLGEQVDKDMLALMAAARLPGIRKLALYEAPLIVDDSRATTQGDWAAIRQAIADDRRGDAVSAFLQSVGMAGLVPGTRCDPRFLQDGVAQFRRVPRGGDAGQRPARGRDLRTAPSGS